MPTIETVRPNGRLKVEFVCAGESVTEQSHRDEVNINSIMRKANRVGYLPTYGHMPTYGDFSATGSYQEALDQCLAAEREFMSLPSGVRKRFDNDPGKLIDFLEDAGNLDEAIELGLVEAPVVPPPAPEAVSEAVNEAGTGSGEPVPSPSGEGS